MYYSILISFGGCETLRESCFFSVASASSALLPRSLLRSPIRGNFFCVFVLLGASAYRRWNQLWSSPRFLRFSAAPRRIHRREFGCGFAALWSAQFCPATLVQNKAKPGQHRSITKQSQADADCGLQNKPTAPTTAPACRLFRASTHQQNVTKKLRTSNLPYGNPVPGSTLGHSRSAQ